MTRIKSIYYNNCIDLLIIFLLLIISGYIYCKQISAFPFIFACVIYITYVIKNRIRNKKLHYLMCSYSTIKRGSVWINQRQCIKKEKNICPQKAFVKEMNTLLESIPLNIICYCCTHEVIKNGILKKYPNAQINEAYKSNLIKLKKKLKVSACKNCKSKTCTLLKNEKVQFYNIKFVCNKYY